MENSEETETKTEKVSNLPRLDEKTLEILKEIHKDMEFGDPVVDEDINW